MQGCAAERGVSGRGKSALSPAISTPASDSRAILPQLSGRYMDVRTVIRGIQHVAQELFGLEVEDCQADPHELWAPPSHIRKFSVAHVKEGRLGTLYLDFFARPGKSVCLSRAA